jgi:AmmeMemoRadiSam system protein B
MDGTRLPAVAGAFYPDDAAGLKAMISGMLGNAAMDESAALLPEKAGRLRGIVVPHAGYVYSGPVAAYAYLLLGSAALKPSPKKFIILGPSHYAAFPGLAESGSSQWKTPLGTVPAFSIIKKSKTAGKTGKSSPASGAVSVLPACHNPEHSLEVQLPFLQVAMEGKEISVDPILTGDIGPEEGADALETAIKGAFLVVSSDLSHYMPYDDAVAKDHETLSILDSMDAGRFAEEGDACGRAGISIAMALARRLNWKFHLLKYANSGDTAGPKNEVVGYAALAIVEGK